MLHKALSSALIASLIGSSLLTGCANHFERSYKPAVTSDGTPVTPPTTPLLMWSQDLDSDGKTLAQEGYVLIGTSSIHAGVDHCYAPQAGGPGWINVSASEAKAAVAQGKRVRAAVVLLKVDFWVFPTSDDVGSPHCDATFFATYWAKAARPADT